MIGIKFISEIFEKVRKLVVPPSIYCWQTIILLSLFSCVMSYLSTGMVRDILASFGWIFLIFGASWATTDNPPKIYGFSLSPWITGALLCYFIFGTWKGADPQIAFVCWPPISAVLASLREFFDYGLKFKVPAPPARQNILLMMLSNLLLSCWIQFYFVTQNWVDQYPTLLVDDYGKSAFVMRIDPRSDVTPRGAVLLNLMEFPLRQELNNKPWPQVEKWLLEPQARIDAIKKQAQKQLPAAEEDYWWKYSYKILSANSGYNLQLQADWDGPRSKLKGYSIKKSCQITPAYKESVPGTISKINCAKMS